MNKINTREFLLKHQIEEKTPYFGKARLLQLISSPDKSNKFFIPREIFHFITAIYILDSNINNIYTMKINSFNKDIESKMFSKLGNDETRINILGDPIFLGQNIMVSIEMKNNPTELQVCHLLVEFAKISPELYQSLHTTDSTILTSKQDDVEILQIRGNC